MRSEPRTTQELTDLDFQRLPPRADSVIESLRAIGYEVTTAIADIIDNSIAAGAKNVSVHLYWNRADSWIRVSDDGTGMSAEELTQAMRLGSQSPLAVRGSRDLGRFGLGLKTASFSQCRRLTVRSARHPGEETTRCWDLDVVARERDWILLNQAADPSADELLSLPSTPGTVVLWQHLDRVLPDPGAPSSKDRFLDAIESIYTHLATVFHRFLSGPSRIKITVNDKKVEPWDPFLVDEIATQRQPEEVFELDAQLIKVQAYVLPHESKLTAEKHRAAAGTAGWNAQQGFYVYRNHRLLMAGGWFGFFQQEEHYKLARIQIDIPNTLDAQWQIDIRKATARPPASLRSEFLRVAKKTREDARRIYGHRAAVLRKKSSVDISPVWEEIQSHGQISYRINRRHQMISESLLNPAPSPHGVAAILRVIEETLPVSLITSRFAENSLTPRAPFQGAEDLTMILIDVANQLYSMGMSRQDVETCVMRMEPFCHYPDVLDALPDNPTTPGA